MNKQINEKIKNSVRTGHLLRDTTNEKLIEYNQTQKNKCTAIYQQVLEKKYFTPTPIFLEKCMPIVNAYSLIDIGQLIKRNKSILGINIGVIFSD
tara:strand:+ start:687 stop:971 length:285 start_codon:yes stop_codon:yes gene_type:complete